MAKRPLHPKMIAHGKAVKAAHAHLTATQPGFTKLPPAERLTQVAGAHPEGPGLMDLSFGQCLPSELPPERATITDPDGTRPQAISARSVDALDAHALAIFEYRQAYGIYRDA